MRMKKMQKMLVALSALLCAASIHAASDVGQADASSSPLTSSNDAALQNLEIDFGAAVKPANLKLRSSAVLVVDQGRGEVLYAKNTGAVMPIASITKLMTAMVVLDANLPLDQPIAIENADVDTLRRSSSRLRVGSALPRGELLRLALMASENRAAAALARAYPGGKPAFIAAMNRKAADLGMSSTHFVDSSGLHSENVSNAQDLVRLVNAGYGYDLIREFTTTSRHQVAPAGMKRAMAFKNSNGLVKKKNWQIGLSKTGYIQESGRCLVMQAKIAARSVIIVLLDSWGKRTRIADANRIKKWMEGGVGRKQRLS